LRLSHSNGVVLPAPDYTRDLASILTALQVPRGGVLYVQCSLDWMQRGGINTATALPTLIDWTQGGTLVMPSYPFHSTHQAYLETRPSYDVKRTPSAIGLLPEALRRTKGAVRSLDPDFSVVAYGADAAAIAGEAPAATDTFGPDSSYQRMIDRGATALGLGVSLNTCSFIHVIDSRMAESYPRSPWLEPRYALSVIDREGRSLSVERQALRPEFQQRTKPANIIDTMRPDSTVFSSLDIDGARFFRWHVPEWASWCTAHAAERAGQRAWPCWLESLEASPS
jgi:aminoglycoside N3'-acetyltransferase